MTWNYRVMRRTIDGETHDAIHEVFYRNDGTIRTWTKNPTTIHSEPHKMSEVLDMVLVATTKPVLDYETGKEI